VPRQSQAYVTNMSEDTWRAPHAYPSTPAGFDLETATAEVLDHHGLGQRPDPVRSPHLHRVWTEVFAEATFVEADLVASDYTRGRRPPRPYAPAAPESLPSGWAGVTLPFGRRPEYDEPASSIYAQWVVPDVADADPAGDEVLNVGFWIGIDGGIDESDDILQAGISVTVQPTSHGPDVQWYAWTEWFDTTNNLASRKVANFPVAVGDTIAVLVAAMEPNLGRVMMANVTAGHATVVQVPAPGQVTSAGRTVEWIVESPGGSHGLPMFEPFEFTDCFAETGDGVLHPDLGYTTEITAMVPAQEFGHAITRTTITSQTSVKVEWEQFN
jgi:hypothetical protein